MMVFDIYIITNQPHGHMCPLILNTTQTSFVTPHFWVLPQHKRWVHLSCIGLAVVISFIYGNVPVSMLFSFFFLTNTRTVLLKSLNTCAVLNIRILRRFRQNLFPFKQMRKPDPSWWKLMLVSHS